MAPSGAMGAYDPPLPSTTRSRSRSPRRSPLSPTLTKNMLGRPGDARRKTLLFILLGGIFVMSMIAFRSHDEIEDIMETSRSHWGANSAGSDTANQTAEYGRYKPPQKEGITPLVVSDWGDEKTMMKEEDGKDGGKKEGEKGEKSIEALDERLDNSTQEDVTPGPTMNERELHDETLLQLRNDTLGFGRVYVLNMPERTDKLDAIRLTSSLANFTFEPLPGINGKVMSPKAIPGNFSDGYQGDRSGVIGCWRGHMNFANKVIENRLSSALILEDDADWDVSLRSQLEHIALGSQALLNHPKENTPHSPYGDGWDLLWLGHCGSQPVQGDNQRVLFKNDKTVPPPSHRTNWDKVPQMWPHYDNTTRIMYFTQGGVCTYAYAISYHGAQKMLKWLSMEIYKDPIDFGLRDLCSDHTKQFKCIGVFPQIIGDHKQPGGAEKDSDIDDGGKHNIRKKGFTYNIVHSARVNADVLIDGHPEQAEVQWPRDVEKVEGEVQMEWRDEEVPDIKEPEKYPDEEMKDKEKDEKSDENNEFPQAREQESS